MAQNKTIKKKNGGSEESAKATDAGEITSSTELKNFLQNLLDRLSEGQVAGIYALSALNTLLSKPEMYSLFNVETKELARDIWLRIKQAGVQVRNPPALFGIETDGPAT